MPGSQQGRPRAWTKVVVVTDEPDKYPAWAALANWGHQRIHHREEPDDVQKMMREVMNGPSGLATDHAPEKRSAASGSTFPDPQSVIINERCAKAAAIAA